MITKNTLTTHGISPRLVARLRQAQIRLGHGKVGELPDVGICVHSDGLHLRIGNLTLLDQRKPLIGFERKEPGMLRSLCQKADAHRVVGELNASWHRFTLLNRDSHKARQSMAKYN